MLVPSKDMVRVERYGGEKSALSELSTPRQKPCQVVSNGLGLGFEVGNKVNMFDL
jgi:hypothetical protein